MKFGIYVAAQTAVDKAPSENFTESLLMVRLARKLGFDSIATGHHYLSSPYRQFQPIPFLARLSAESGQMRIGLLVMLLSLLNPVDVAEQISTMDVMTDGRFIFGVGLGYRDVEFEAFKIRREEKISRLEESLELIKMLWTKDTVSYDGKHFKLNAASLTMKPIQRPYPPIWMAANSDAAVVRAARLADAWIVNPHVSLNTIERQVEIYKDALNKNGKAFPKEFPAIRELYVARTTEQAFDEARPHLESKYRTYSEWGQDKTVPKGEEFARPFEELSKNRFVIGSPEDCIESIHDIARRTGINHFVFRMNWPKSEFEQTIKSMKLLARKVVPYFRAKA